jgi:hypothetical protein
VVIVSLESGFPDLAWPEAERLTAQELTMLDFEVVVVQAKAGGEPERRQELAGAAELHGAVGALQILRRGEAGATGVELWVADLVTGKTTIRELEMGDAEASIVALRAVELFRASLLELHVAAEPPAPPPSPPVVELAGELPEEPPGPVGLRLGIAALGSPGGAGAHGAVSWGVSFDLVRWLRLEVEGAVTFAGADVRDHGSASTFGQASARVWLLYDIRARGVVRPAVGLGGGMVAAWARGLSAAEGATALDGVVSGYTGATAQLALAVSRSVWLRLGATAGVALPRIRVMFADAVAASFGLPVLEGWFAVEARVP